MGKKKKGSKKKAATPSTQLHRSLLNSPYQPAPPPPLIKLRTTGKKKGGKKENKNKAEEKIEMVEHAEFITGNKYYFEFVDDSEEDGDPALGWVSILKAGSLLTSSCIMILSSYIFSHPSPSHTFTLLDTKQNVTGFVWCSNLGVHQCGEIM